MKISTTIGIAFAASLTLAACGDDAEQASASSGATSGPGTGGDGTGGDGTGGGTGGAGATGGAGGAGGAVTGSCAEVAGSICDFFQKCLPFLLESAYPDLATCVTLQTKVCENAEGAPGNGFKPDDYATCAAAIDAATCDEVFSGEITCTDDPGTLSDGLACGADSQCQSGNCDLGPDAFCGNCAPLVASGGDCSAVGAECAPGTGCDPMTDTCVALGKTGEACGAGAPCIFTTYCSAGTCVAQGQSGDACSMNEPCAFFGGFQCIMGTCAPIPLGDVGDACGFQNGAFAVCKGGASCVNDVCVAPIPDGAACMTGPGDAQCQDPSECVNGTCTFPDASACQ